MKPMVPQISERAADTVIRVAYVVYRFDVGGLERCVARLCEHLDRGRFRPMVVCLERSGAAAGWITREDVEIVELHKKPRNDLGAIRRLARVLKENEVDIVHSHNWGTLLETALARRWAGVPVHVHAERGTLLGEVNGRGLRYRLRTRAMGWALRRCDAVVTNAESTRERIARMVKFAADRIDVIPNGVTVPACADRAAARSRIRRELGVSEGALVVGSVGRLVSVKNFAMAIDALAQPLLAEQDVHLVLVGDGPDYDGLSARSKGLGVADRVHLPGGQQDIGNWLAAMDVYVNTSKSEGMSQSIVEAMAAGLPLVVTDVGDNRALVDGETPCGLVVASGDAAALAGATDELCHQPDRRADFAEEAHRRHAERFGIETMTDDYEALYERLAAVSAASKAAEPENAPA